MKLEEALKWADTFGEKAWLAQGATGGGDPMALDVLAAEVRRLQAVANDAISVAIKMMPSAPITDADKEWARLEIARLQLPRRRRRQNET